MIPSDGRAAVVKRLADIDQQIALAGALATCRFLTLGEQRRARAHQHYYRAAATRIEKLLKVKG